MKFLGSRFTRSLTGIMVGALIGVAPAFADVRLPAIFGDHMVLQRGKAVSIWGWADPGETVSVQIESASASAVAGADGKWSAKLDSLSTPAMSTSLTISGKNEIELKDVLIGDVWICAGQSNMGWSVSAAVNGPTTQAQAKDDDLRLFLMDGKLSFEPLGDCKGKWVRCSPASVGPFSAVGYFFGRDLREHLKVPIGLVEISIGGSASQAWTSREALGASPALKPMMDAFRRDEPALRQKLETYETVTVPKWKQDDQAWQKEILPAYQAELAKWNDAVKQAKAAGQPEPPKPQPSKPHSSLAAPPNRLVPTTCFNGMIEPVLPLTIKGVVWFQGEHNTFDPKLYADLFPVMIQDWRAHFGQGDFPFIYGQIADNAPPSNGGMNLGKWALVREVQLKLDAPQVGMAVSVDVGDPNDVHFRNKQPVGQRLALVARRVAYGESIDASGPIFDQLEVGSGQAVVHFKYADDGLISGTPPTDSPFATATTDALVGFEIAGADRKFVPADATIDGSRLIVKSSQVAQPVAVRYGWADAPKVNLYNRHGLPASSFRTDSWEK